MSDRENSGFGKPHSAMRAIRLMAGGVFLLLLADSGGLSLDARSSLEESKTNV